MGAFRIVRSISVAVFLSLIFVTSLSADQSCGIVLGNQFAKAAQRAFVLRQKLGVQDPLNILIIDGGHPDLEHPDFRDSQAHSIIHPIDVLEYDNGAERPPGWKDDPNSQRQKFEESLVAKGWRARFSSWWFSRVANGPIKDFVSKETSVQRILTRTLPLLSMASAGWVYLHTGDSHIFHNAWHFFRAHLNTLYYAPLAAKAFFIAPQFISPKQRKLRWQQIHPTHVSGTIARGLAQARNGLTIHTMNMNEVSGSDPSEPVYEPQQGLLQRLKDGIERFKRQKAVVTRSPEGGRVSPLNADTFEQEAKLFLQQFFADNEEYMDGVINYIQKNKIRAVNMSYGIDQRRAIPAIERIFEQEFGINPSPGTDLAQSILDMFRKQYIKLFENCPNTAFFIAAGNDSESINNGSAVFQDIIEPNVFVSAAATDDYQLAGFSSFGIMTKLLNRQSVFARMTSSTRGNVSSASFGVKRLSSYPGGSTTKLSGTSMASPESMLTYLYLIALDPSLSVSDALELMRQGVVKDETMKTEVTSGGVTVLPQVFTEYLLFHAKKLGYLKDVELEPILHVHPSRLPGYKPDKKKTPPADESLEPQFALSAEAAEVLMQFLDAVSPPAGKSVEEATLRQAEEETKTALHHINRQRTTLQLPLLQYFMDAQTRRNLLAKYEIADPIPGETFETFFERAIAPAIKAKQLDNSHLIQIVAFVRDGGKLTPGEATLLRDKLVAANVKKHYIKSLFKRLLAVLPPDQVEVLQANGF